MQYNDEDEQIPSLDIDFYIPKTKQYGFTQYGFTPQKEEFGYKEEFGTDKGFVICLFEFFMPFAYILIKIIQLNDYNF